MNRQDRFFFVSAMTARADRVAAETFFQNDGSVGGKRGRCQQNDTAKRRNHPSGTANEVLQHGFFAVPRDMPLV